MKIEFRVKKILGRMHRYSASPEILEPWKSRLALEEGEALLGVYRNDPGDDPEEIVVSDRGLFLRSGELIRRIKYDSILDTKSPVKDPPELDLWITISSGESVRMRVAGRKERTRDAYEFERFLMRVSPNYTLGTISLRDSLRISPRSRT